MIYAVCSACEAASEFSLDQYRKSGDENPRASSRFGVLWICPSCEEPSAIEDVEIFSDDEVDGIDPDSFYVLDWRTKQVLRGPFDTRRSADVDIDGMFRAVSGNSLLALWATFPADEPQDAPEAPSEPSESPSAVPVREEPHYARRVENTPPDERLEDTSQETRSSSRVERPDFAPRKVTMPDYLRRRAASQVAEDDAQVATERPRTVTKHELPGQTQELPVFQDDMIVEQQDGDGGIDRDDFFASDEVRKFLGNNDSQGPDDDFLMGLS